MSGEAQAALEARARAGDVSAQFDLAVALDRASKRGEASSWLEAAAQGGHPTALTLSAIGDLQGLERPRNRARAVERLRQAVAAGSNPGRALLAVTSAIGLVTDPDWQQGVDLLIDAGKGGHWEALRALGFLCEMASPKSALGEDLLLRAGLMGDGLAAFAVLRRQAGGRVLAAEEYCAQWRAGIAQLKHPLANLVISQAPLPGDGPNPPGPNPDWEPVRALLKQPPGVTVPPPVQVSERPYVRRFNKLMSAEECEYLIGISARYLRPAQIVDQESGDGRRSDLRTNSVGVLWPEHQDLVVHALNLRLAATAGLPPENGEMINVLMYRPGEEYRPHYDFFPVEAAKADPSGQRVRTLLVYLNTDYDAGETRFLVAGMKIKGEVGDAILFHNCDAAGAPDKSSLHAGTPVAHGQKWLLSKWWREKPFVY